MEYQNQRAKEGRFCEKLKIKNKPKFVGVRQRASGKWAAEIKHTSKKIRLQLLVCVKSNSNDGILIFSVKLVT